MRLRNDVRSTFLSERLNKHVKVIQMNGFQIKGTLVAFDAYGLKLLTTQYSNDPNEEREIFVQNHSYATVI